MGRIPRAEFRGALYHVFSRGNRRERIFLDDDDYARYLQDVQDISRELGVDVLAYCLMPNHPHLCVQTHDTPLRVLMHRLNTRHAKRFNRKYSLRGHLHEGRYRALLVEERVYLLRLIRYIHQNPVRAGLVQRAGDWPFSSYSQYLQPESWVARARVFSQFADSAAFEAFMDSSPEDDHESQVFTVGKRGFCFAGSLAGVADVTDAIARKPDYDCWRWQKASRDAVGDTARAEEEAVYWLTQNCADVNLAAIQAPTQSEPVRSHRRRLAVYLSSRHHSVSCIARVFMRDVGSMSRLLSRSARRVA